MTRIFKAVWGSLKRFIKNRPLLAMPAVLAGKVLPGFFQYARLICKYGSDVSILRTAWHGTGDYYICGMYLPAYLEENKISNYVFLVSKTGSEAKVTELFDVYKGHTEKLHSVEAISRFSEFMQNEKPLCKSFESSDQLSFIGEQLKGYRGLTLMDFYLWHGFGFSTEPKRTFPHFCDDVVYVQEKMQKQGLRRQKTVLLSPYSTCSKAYLPPESFWEEIAVYLEQKGYTVATNCFGSEEPVRGTIPVEIPYSELVPFLNEAGGFIGIRSGLCDILSLSSCRKIIIYPEKSDFWPDGRAREFVGIESMGLAKGVYELIYCERPEITTEKVCTIVDEW